MADHFAVMAGRLLTESTVQSAIDEASAAAMPSSVIASEHNDVQDEREKSGVLVECRICQEEDDQTYMETPCSCRGSLKVKFSIKLIKFRFCNSGYARFSC